jgi:periplasmic divalent cation tolerance protein
VNIVKNVESIYEWKGAIEHDNEVLMVIKSQSEKSQDLAKFVQANHPYECPEVVTLKVSINLILALVDLYHLSERI